MTLCEKEQSWSWKSFCSCQRPPSSFLLPVPASLLILGRRLGTWSHTLYSTPICHLFNLFNILTHLRKWLEEPERGRKWANVSEKNFVKMHVTVLSVRLSVCLSVCLNKCKKQCDWASEVPEKIEVKELIKTGKWLLLKNMLWSGWLACLSFKCQQKREEEEWILILWHARVHFDE